MFSCHITVFAQIIRALAYCTFEIKFFHFGYLDFPPPFCDLSSSAAAQLCEEGI